MSMREHWPVIVIGAGPTGLTTANLLAQDGVAVLLVERNASTVQEPRAVSIDDESLRTMQPSASSTNSFRILCSATARNTSRRAVADS